MNRTIKVGIRLTPAEDETWRAEAKAADLSLAHYLRRMIAAGRAATASVGQ